MIKLVLVRHGESVWNLENKFTGWTDVDLSEKGVKEALEAGKVLKEQGYTFDKAYTSILLRANKTLDLIKQSMGVEIPTDYDYRLNERHYGALQGLNKQETADKYGEEQVKLWRRSYKTFPPELDLDDPRYPGNQELYKDIPKDKLPRTENLEKTVERVVEEFNEKIRKDLLDNKKIIIVAHGNSLRALCKYLENISDDDIINLNIPTGNPLVFELDDNLKVINKYYLKEE